ncbi:uncharacterized protein BDZ99DRAFT_301311 [Mytilinidion resinicola]|uniref:Uncharacterized protein n=1 Tax=Mytilinidion resinicola TaxID=574789 RepID=A0A6A6YM90_9PEZI|nr:uncharacterized protein BDZ99DRAFT_301311 [Mytilinidion resinicola]KAF2809996.1 hypothetical protein BDZ99DRAFT_301311 [Mytilinidion resinicola]
MVLSVEKLWPSAGPVAKNCREAAKHQSPSGQGKPPATLVSRLHGRIANDGAVLRCGPVHAFFPSNRRFILMRFRLWLTWFMLVVQRCLVRLVSGAKWRWTSFLHVQPFFFLHAASGKQASGPVKVPGVAWVDGSRCAKFRL